MRRTNQRIRTSALSPLLQQWINAKEIRLDNLSMENGQPLLFYNRHLLWALGSRWCRRRLCFGPQQRQFCPTSEIRFGDNRMPGRTKPIKALGRGMSIFVPHTLWWSLANSRITALVQILSSVYLPLVMLIKLCWPMLGVDPECFM